MTDAAQCEVFTEAFGHRWPIGDGTTGREPCKNCGISYCDFSLGLQYGKITQCAAQKREIDGVIVMGLES